MTGFDESESANRSGEGGTGDIDGRERPDVGSGGRGAGGVMTDAMGGGTGQGVGHRGGAGLGAGLAGATQSGDIGTGAPNSGSAAGTGTTGAIPESQHEGIMGPGASDTTVASSADIPESRPRGAGTEARRT